MPNNSLQVLFNYYGDIYKLPADMVSHFQHVSRDLLENERVVDAIEEDIATNTYATNTYEK
ncbi:hypothetical protein ACNF5J_00905 [Fannyhessea vaginae]|uniref:hypothetical protein n=1 Tax=Fannyhessea vaginae TaxID=82135 RepID=UPI00288B999B|nr:hypothetical protein [Fannyhessea vaginae]